MTGCSDESMDEIASKFIVGTCQMLPKLCDSVSDLMYIIAPGVYHVPCGSSAEFCIRPLNQVMHDLDVLRWNTSELAFTEDIPVLPEDVSRLSDTVQCHVIESYLSHPGFVRLRIFGEMKYNWKYKRYSFIYATRPHKYNRVNFDGSKSGNRQGPSIRTQVGPTFFTQDHVHSVRCPQWPKEAQFWPKRHRHSGWPSTKTLSEVVQHGCHVVYAQHRACRNDSFQWRL